MTAGRRILLCSLLFVFVFTLMSCGGQAPRDPDRIAKICDKHQHKIDKLNRLIDRHGEKILERIKQRAPQRIVFIIEECLGRGDGGQQPGGPGDVQASPVDRTQVSSFRARNAFLYTGEDPIQTGVDSGTIKFKRSAVIRGRVLDENNEPLSGVTISIKDHPEFGKTTTRSDGMYDMAVNGGGKLTVRATLQDHFLVQRPVDVPWRDYVRVDDMVMIPMDDQVTTVDLTESTNVQVHQASTQTDTNGSRQATLMFKPNTQATVIDSTGETESVSSLDVRATEYSVGENGQERMPAPLPPTSTYTYAVELSADQTLSENQDGDSVFQTVRFNQPVPVYLENFLGFPVGTPVPSGVYDREEGRWAPKRNGWVLEVVGESGGVANVDVTGDGMADTPGRLEIVGVDMDERQQLASMYDPGDSLWRVPVRNFSPWDFNWGLDWFPDQVAPSNEKAADPQQECPKNMNCECPGSSICLQNQTAEENVDVVGTPYSLTYKTSRTKGYRPNFTLDIPLTKSDTPNRLKRIKLEIHIAGKTITRTFEPKPNLTHTFEWDGRDAYGRELQGRHTAEVRIGYVYDKFYKVPLGSDIEDARERLRESGRSSFTVTQVFSGGVVLSPPGRRGEGTRWQSYFKTLGTVDNEALKTGAWQLNVHHTYDPEGQVLYEGDGDFRNARAKGNVIETIAGGGSSLADTVQAKKAKLHQPIGIDVGPDGSIYIAERHPRSLIRKISPDGTITVVAGRNEDGGKGFNGDGILATNARLKNPRDVSLDDRGRIFIADRRNHRIRMVDEEGIIHTVAGTGQSGFNGDNIQATEARIHRPRSVAIGPNGDIYFGANKRVRKVVTGGTIYTVAGGHKAGKFKGPFEVPATKSRLRGIFRVEFGPEGDLYIATGSWQVVKVTSDGIVHVVAGNGNFFAGAFHLGDDPRKSTLTQPTGMAIAPDGTVFINDRQKTGGHARGINNMVTKVDPTENIHKKVAGIARERFSGDGGPARLAGLNNPWDIALGPDNNLYIAERRSNRVRVVKSPFPSAQLDKMTVPSEDGSRIFVFDHTGRHLRTVDARTGTTLFSFEYNDDGLLTAVTDRDSQTTTIQRNSDGQATAIVSPFGQNTQLTTNSTGFLTEVINPASEIHQMTYGDSGLLQTFTDPMGNQTTLSYDTRGRLVRDEDPAGGFQELVRDETDTTLRITRTTAMGRTSSLGFEELSLGDGDRAWTTVGQSGLADTTISRANGTTRQIGRDGTVTETRRGPDPRFGMLASVQEQQTIETPSGRRMTIEQDHSVVEGQDLELSRATDTTAINGRTFTQTYDGSTRTLTNTSPEGRTTTTTLNEQARVTSIDQGDLLPTMFSYNDDGQVTETSQGDRTSSFTYNTDGFLSEVTDPVGRTTQFSYDQSGRVTIQTLPDGRQIDFQYDDKGNLTALTPPGREAHVFRYTSRDQTQEYEPPSLPSGSTITTWTYNLDKQLTQIQRPDMTTVNFGYDDAGRLSNVDFPADQRTLNYSGSTGKLTDIQSSNGVNLSFAYDGSLPTQVQWNGTDVNGSLSLTYDNSFRVTQQTINGSTNVSFNYDRDGLLTGAGDLALNRDVQTGLLASSSLGDVQTTWSHNDFGEVIGRTTDHAGDPLYSFTTQRDTAGRIVGLAEAISGNDTRVRTFEYDEVGRLVGVNRGSDGTVAYQYDSNGNRTARTGADVNQTDFQYDDQDRLISYRRNGDTLVEFTYTANGELQSKTVGSQPSTTYDYDALGNLRSVTLMGDTTIEYLIDGQNRRVGKRINGQFKQGFIYQDQLNPIAELDENGDVETVFVYGAKTNVPSYMIKNGTKYRIVSNHLGSVRMVVNTSNGDIVQRIKYDAFGRVILDTNPGFQPFGFAGGLYDHQTGLVRFGARDYDPTVGRWTSKDPILFGSGTTNLFGYVLNEPINRLDIQGLAMTFFGGAEETIAVPFLETGAEGNAGVFVTIPDNPFDPSQLKNCLDIGLFGGIGTALGAEGSAGLTVGAVAGDADALSGPTQNLNLATPPKFFPRTKGLGGSVIFDRSGNPIGFSLDPGPGAGASRSITITGTISVRDVISYVRGVF